MSLTVALQMDPPGGINPASDTTMLLALEAQKRGHTLHYYAADTLHVKDGDIRTSMACITFRDQLTDWHTLKSHASVSLKDIDVVLMRQDPPFHMGYITATYLLERAMPETFVTNHPGAVRNNPEKLFPLEFPEFTPPTLIGQDIDAVKEFLKTHKKIVLKPLYGFGGHSVFVLEEGGANIAALLETLSLQKEPLVAQAFLPAISDGDRRVIFIDGKVVACFARLTAEDDIRANMRVGGKPAKAELTTRQSACSEALGPVLKERGLLLAGVDFIGDHLIEINITCPTGLRAANKLYGTTLEKAFWDAVESKL